jgi:hypothetical protein
MAVTEPDSRDELEDPDEPPVHDLDDPAEPVGDGAPSSRARRVSDVAERERLVARTVADATARDTRYQGMRWQARPAVRWWKWGIAALLVVGALLALAAPPTRVAGPPLPSLSPEDRTAGLQAALVLLAGHIEAYRARTGRLPQTLEEVGGSFPGVRYVRSNNRVFQLVAVRDDGSVRVWDSADPSPERERLARRWLTPPDRP